MGKVCAKCNVEKSLDNFGVHKQTKSGLRCWCKECVRAANLAWKLRNPELRKKHNDDWRLANSDKRRESAKGTYWRNVETARAKMRAYQQNEREILSDTYIARKMNMTLDILPPKLIDLKRAHIQLKRLLREHK